MRSKLFVPASRPELFPKALASAADAISFDLEDAVDEQAKPMARAALAPWLRGDLAALRGKQIVVRVNPVDSLHFAADLEAVVWQGLDVLNLPKIEDAAAVKAAAEALSRIERSRGLKRAVTLLVNIESPQGLRRAAEIAAAHPRIMGLQLGFGDLFAPLGIASSEPFATQSARLAVRMAAAEAGVEAFDGAYVNIANPAGFRRDALRARRLGFSGKSCIHPSQVALANEVFSHDEAEVAHALRVVEAADRAAGTVGAFVVDGRLVDGPFITRARRIARQAATTSTSTQAPAAG